MSKRGKSENPSNATDAQLEEFYNKSSNGKESGLKEQFRFEFL